MFDEDIGNKVYLDAETQVLTKNSWKTLETALDTNHEIMQLTDDLEFCYAPAKITTEYSNWEADINEYKTTGLISSVSPYSLVPILDIEDNKLKYIKSKELFNFNHDRLDKIAILGAMIDCESAEEDFRISYHKAQHVTMESRTQKGSFITLRGKHRCFLTRKDSDLAIACFDTGVI